jgi:hypothetical protein
MNTENSIYRRLKARKIIDTAEALRRRVLERFPEAGLGRLVSELLKVADETTARIAWIQRPHLPLRIGVGLLITALVALAVWCVAQIFTHTRGSAFEISSFGDFTSAIQAVDAGIGSIVFIGVAVLFLLNWEVRIKRGRAIRALHELRAMAHIVDMHQLTKDPESYVRPGHGTTSSPVRAMTPFELNRYLDYCSEALSVLSKIAALYVQDFEDSVLLDAVDDVEDLTTGFSRKIWQKITIIEMLTGGGKQAGG